MLDEKENSAFRKYSLLTHAVDFIVVCGFHRLLLFYVIFVRYLGKVNCPVDRVDEIRVAGASRVLSGGAVVPSLLSSRKVPPATNAEFLLCGPYESD